MLLHKYFKLIVLLSFLFQFVPILFVISTSSMLIMDQRTMQIKYRIPAAEIFKLSLSPYHDDIAVFHVRAVSILGFLKFIYFEKASKFEKNLPTILFDPIGSLEVCPGSSGVHLWFGASIQNYCFFELQILGRILSHSYLGLRIV